MGSRKSAEIMQLTSEARTKSLKMLVLRERIELSTSPLPMECSTTELPQPGTTRRGARRQGGGLVPWDARRGKRGLRDPARNGMDHGMTANSPPESAPPAATNRAAERKRQQAERLASALRENLRRRKEQARVRAGAPDPDPTGE